MPLTTAPGRRRRNEPTSLLETEPSKTSYFCKAVLISRSTPGLGGVRVQSTLCLFEYACAVSASCWVLACSTDAATVRNERLSMLTRRTSPKLQLTEKV